MKKRSLKWAAICSLQSLEAQVLPAMKPVIPDHIRYSSKLTSAPFTDVLAHILVLETSRYLIEGTM